MFADPGMPLGIKLAAAAVGLAGVGVVVGTVGYALWSAGRWLRSRHRTDGHDNAEPR